MKLVFGLMKLSVLALYLLAAASLFVPVLADYSSVLGYIILALLAAHLGEYMLVRKRLAQLSANGGHFLGTMLFGFLYWLPLFRAESES